MLTGLRLELGHMARIHDHANVELGSCIARAKGVAERTLEAIRNIAMMLRPPMLDDLGLSPALAWLVKELPKPSGLEVRAEIDPGVDRLPDAHRTCVYRVVQEALTNAVRHAKARKIRVSLTMDGPVLRGSVADDGRGFDPHSVKSCSEGLSIMAERIKELNGSISIVSAPKHGVRIEFTLPCPISSGDHDDSDSASRRPRDNSSRIEASV
jgi:signal transduction histidine kinase